jgi:hypothetical protein
MFLDVNGIAFSQSGPVECCIPFIFCIFSFTIHNSQWNKYDTIQYVSNSTSHEKYNKNE